MQKIIITIDTEGDNLWGWREGQTLTTENVSFVPRFQDLCEKYGFIPTYLTTYEMALEERWNAYAKQKQHAGKCEIGLHIHAWNNPPIYPLPKLYRGKPFITEYPGEIAFEKMQFLKKLLEERFECQVFSARSGRFGTDAVYFEIMDRLGLTVDCSITPQIDLSATPGRTVPSCNNYMDADICPSFIYKNVLEVPLTSRRTEPKSPGASPYIWMRPVGFSAEELLQLADRVEAEEVDNIEFMLHSSEMMPGGSPYFKTAEDIEQLFFTVEKVFSGLADRNYTGISLSDYRKTADGL